MVEPGKKLSFLMSPGRRRPLLKESLIKIVLSKIIDGEARNFFTLANLRCRRRRHPRKTASERRMAAPFPVRPKFFLRKEFFAQRHYQVWSGGNAISFHMFFVVENSKNLVDKGEIALGVQKSAGEQRMVNWQQSSSNLQFSNITGYVSIALFSISPQPTLCY